MTRRGEGGKGRRSRGATSEGVAEATAATDAPLEALPAEPPYLAPRPLVMLLLALALAGAGFFVAEGVGEARLGRGRLAEKLLGVEVRTEYPRAFTLPAMTGGQVALDQLRGKVVFINFWATWCPPCVEEMPSMRRLHEKLAGDPRFAMLAVSTDEDWAVVRQFFAGAPPGFQVLLDPKGEVARGYGTEKFPETYVVVDGELVGYIIGPRDWDTWYAEAYLRELLARGKLRG